MTDIEFDILDELYFVTSFDVLLGNVSLEKEMLVEQLDQLLKKGWIRCFIDISGGEPSEDIDLTNQYMKYYYLASKEGLKAHNSL